MWQKCIPNITRVGSSAMTPMSRSRGDRRRGALLLMCYSTRESRLRASLNSEERVKLLFMLTKLIYSH